MKKILIIGVAGLLVSGLMAQAQLNWDPGITGGPAGGDGTWDTSTGNWWDGTQTTWDNTGATTAVIPVNAANQTIAVTTGVKVGDLTYADNKIMQLKGAVNNSVLEIKSGGATWDTGGGQIEFLNNNTANLSLSLTSGDTLTVNGGGEFDTGEKPNGADWVGAGATLDVTAATTVRGNAASIGQIATVKLAGGSTYIHERNVDQSYNNNWELGAGTVTIDNRYNRNITLNGDITGTGGLKADFLGLKEVTLNGNNTFSGGLEVGTSSRVVASAATELGSGDITLSGNGTAILKLEGVDMGSSRQLVLNDSGGSIVNAGGNAFGGKVTGSGDLQIGDSAYSANVNKLTLSGTTSDHTGDTVIHTGTLGLGADDALSHSTVLSIGGAGNSLFAMDGFDAEIAGLASTGSNTRRIDNNGASTSTLTMNVADGESYTYGANLAGSSAIAIVKTGAGTQTFSKTGFTTAADSVTVNGGLLVWNGNADAATVGTDGTLGGSGKYNGAVTVAGNLNPGNSPGTMTFYDALTLESTSTLTLEFTSTTAGDFDVLLNDGGDTLTAGGVLDLVNLGYSAVEGDSFLVFENWGGYAGSFSSITGTDLGGGLSFDTSSLLTDGTVTVIPEPATLGLVALMGGGLLWIRRVFMV